MQDMSRRLPFRLTTALIFASALLAPPVAAQGDIYTARGQEPGWSLTIGERSITFDTQSGERFEVARPQRQETPQGQIYDVILDGKPVRISIERRLCRDTMSGMPHPDSVSIAGLARQLKGCGGAPRALLGPGEWSITEVDSSPVLAGTAPTLEFAGDAVSGSGSCNRLRGGFKLDGEGLRIEQLAVTMMACPPPIMQQESAIIRKLEATKRFDIRDDGALVLYDNAGKSLVAVRKPKQNG